MKWLPLWCLGMLLLGLSNITYAQAYPRSGPGTGKVVVGQTPASNGVASMPLCQRDDQGNTAPQAPPEKWESRWGAIATDQKKPVLGVATNALSQQEAERNALFDCQSKGGATCKIQVSYANACGAMVVGNGWYSTAYGRTTNEAIQSAMKICNADGAKCHVYYTTCSPAVRVQ